MSIAHIRLSAWHIFDVPRIDPGQIAKSRILPVPALEGVFGRIPQAANGGRRALPQFDIQLHHACQITLEEPLNTAFNKPV